MRTANYTDLRANLKGYIDSVMDDCDTVVINLSLIHIQMCIRDRKEGVDVSITGNSTNPTRFQHPVAGTYKKERVLAGKRIVGYGSDDYFIVAVIQI